jgi:hypothetical protein
VNKKQARAYIRAAIHAELYGTRGEQFIGKSNAPVWMLEQLCADQAALKAAIDDLQLQADAISRLDLDAEWRAIAPEWSLP